MTSPDTAQSKSSESNQPTTSNTMTLSLGGIPVTSPQQALKRFTMLLWGASGSGKTTLAATAPGKKLVIQFDPTGAKVLAGRDDIMVLDLSDQSCTITDRLKQENPLSIEQFIKEHGITTVVLDSLTTLSRLALENAVRSGKYKGASIETPTLGGYGHRNTQVLEITKQIMRSTGRTGTNAIFIAHEDSPEKDDQGVVMFISLMLGGVLPEYTALNMDEVWWLSDTSNKRRIAIRPCRTRKPMKTRMFMTSSDPEFEWRYDPETGQGDTIEKWYASYMEAGRKIALPK